MNRILLSINPEHVENIFNGTKRFEFRKVRCRKEVSKILIYSTNPVMKVVGEADIDETLDGSPEYIWERTSEGAGISKEFFDAYYRGRDRAIAFSLSSFTIYDEPKNISEYDLSAPPQSFAYIE